MKRKGFTLIELLAVIVILAIIAVIATPIIVGIIEDSRKSAFERSVEGIIHATDIDFGTQETLTGSTYKIENGVVNTTLKTPIKNIDGFNGTIKYDENGNSQYAIHNGTWCMMKDDSGVVTTTDYDASTCKLSLPLSDECFVVEDLENGGVAIVDYLCTETDVVIPETINGKVVKEISGLCTQYDDWSSCEGAFEAELVLKREEECYEYCENFSCWDECIYYDYYVHENQIKTIKIPNGVTNIGNDAFAYNKISGELDLTNTNVISIGEFAFTENQITSVKLPSSVINVGNHAFSDNEISSIKLSTSITDIGDYAFSDNAISGELDLRHLINLTNVSGFANNEITSIKLPNNVTSIGELAFSGNAISGELDLRMYENLVSINGFSNNQISSIKLPNSVVSIGVNGFINNEISGELDLSHLINLKNVSGFDANQITSVKLPNSVTNIEVLAFNDNALMSVTFVGRSNLDGVTIEDNVWGWADGYSDENIYFE